jgi:hypothetical protein
MLKSKKKAGVERPRIAGNLGGRVDYALLLVGSAVFKRAGSEISEWTLNRRAGSGNLSVV